MIYCGPNKPETWGQEFLGHQRKLPWRQRLRHSWQRIRLWWFMRPWKTAMDFPCQLPQLTDRALSSGNTWYVTFKDLTKVTETEYFPKPADANTNLDRMMKENYDRHPR